MVFLGLLYLPLPLTWGAVVMAVVVKVVFFGVVVVVSFGVDVCSVVVVGSFVVVVWFGVVVCSVVVSFSTLSDMVVAVSSCLSGGNIENGVSSENSEKLWH